MDDILDSQIIAEQVGFLDNCFDNSFSLQCSILAVKEYVTEEVKKSSVSKKNKIQSSSKPNTSIVNRTSSLNFTAKQSTVSPVKQKVVNRNLKAWGLPEEISRKYQQRGVTEMFEWQVNCLANPKVLLDCSNLVYSAPTSAGKTLVAEILTIKTILERQKKVIIILPFVSIVREKMFYLQDILSGSGIRVEGFMGSQSPPGGLQAVHLAICTIEKANSLINRLLDEGKISDLGAVIVDELHLLGDPHRGYILELLLTKIKYITMKDDIQIQIIGMSATLPNLEVLADWLCAELFVTQFRPIPLDEFCLVGNKFFDKTGKCVNKLQMSVNDSDNVLKICLNTIKDSCSILIFCMTKNRCENLAQTLASSFYSLGCKQCEFGTILREQLKTECIAEVLEQLKNCPVGLDQVLMKTISFGVAYHHAGLTFDERDIIEGGFKSGAIRVLVATSTLSSGVNLPARVVIIRSPVFLRQPINILTYKQMSGRAGRMGKDNKGESILICTDAEKKIGFDLMMGALDPVKSCIESEDKYMRAVLEMIASQVVCTKDDLDLYSKCTLLSAQHEDTSQDQLIENTLKELRNYELVRLQEDDDEVRYVATPLGKACLSASMAPNDGLSLFLELQKARQCLVLETDLHLIYLVTPYSVSSQWADIDWLHLLTLWESLTKAMKRVGELVGVQESFIIRCLRGTNKMNNAENKLNIHKRFYTALALQDLVNEVPLSEVATKFQCARGFLQSLQQAAATFAGMVTAFCHQLGWKNMEILVAQFQDRLHFGIHSELLELMKLQSLNGVRARALFDSGFETITSIASADNNVIENILHKAVPFQSEKEREDDDGDDVKKRNKIKSIWITGCCGMTAKEAALNLIMEARKYLENEIGVGDIKWNTDISKNTVNQEKVNVEKIDTPELVRNIKHENCNEYTTANTDTMLELEPLTNKLRKESINILENSSEDVYSSANICQSSMFKNAPVNSEKNTANKITESHDDIEIKTNLDELQIPNKEIITQKESTPKETLLPNHTLKEEIVWDSLNFTEVGIENITKLKTSSRTFSPNISFGDTDKSSASISITEQNFSSKNASVKDTSLFSTDGETSIFEESLPLDLIPSKLFDNKNSPFVSCMRETTADFENVASRTIANAFRSPLVLSEEEEEVKLVYDTSQEDDVLKIEEEVCSQEKIESIHDFKSPYKRRLDEKENGNHKAKRKKYNNALASSHFDNNQINYSTKATIQIKDFCINCFIVKGEAIRKTFSKLDNIETMSIYLNIQKKSNNINEVIGSNILNIQRSDSDEKQNIKGIAICLNQDNCLYIDLTTLQNITLLEKTAMKSWFESGSSRLKTYSLKWCYLNMRKWLDISLPLTCEDITLTEWLIESDERKIDVEYLMKKYVFDISTAASKVENKQDAFGNDSSSVDACVRAWCVCNIAEKQENAGKEIDKNIKDTQNHVAIILAKCEHHGITIDRQLASQMLSDVKMALESLQKQADRQAGGKLNLNSSKAVAKALGIDRNRRVSTKKSILSCHSSPLASIVIYWRKLNSILTKTLYPLAEKAHENCDDNNDVDAQYEKILKNSDSKGPKLKVKVLNKRQQDIFRIRPSYTMHSCTGRISMHEPNLQNVPRTFLIPSSYLEEYSKTTANCKVNFGKGIETNESVEFNCRANFGKGTETNESKTVEYDSKLNFGKGTTNESVEFNCRHIFKASPGHVMVSADYCQLEMRILTHFSEDAVLLRIMRSGEDIFKSIASSWSNLPEDEVDEDLRQKAKQLCYGILYGMGNKTLSQQLDVTELEAAMFMDSFYRTFPQVKLYTQKVVEECRKKGYVETLMKRRRYLPNINSARPSLKSAAERQAVNTTIQGSAADIAKAAMCAIDNKSHPNYLPQLLLQMHDELIYEVPEKHKENFVQTLKNAMESTVGLKVPLPVKVRSGYSWGTLKEVKIV